MSLPAIRVKFTDDVYGGGREGPIRLALERHFSVNECDHPQLVFYGEGKGREYRRYPEAVRIYIAIENRYPDFSECDYALSYLYLDEPRHLRVPMYVFDSDVSKLLQKHELSEDVISEPRDFCAFLVSNGSKRTGRRLEFFHKLNALRAVSSGGRVLNNVGGPVSDKHAFLRRHRFNLCFENHFWPGYTSEKIGHALAAGCIPIYWGNPAVAADFNPDSFINLSDFCSDDAALEHILKVSESKEMQRKYLSAPSFAGYKLGQSYDVERMAAFFRRAIESPRRIRPLFSPAAALFRIRRQFRLY
jgi:hypothetical protein